MITFNTPYVEVIKFKVTDVITSSDEEEEAENNNNVNPGGNPTANCFSA